jgi:hypothetical protein
MSTAPSPGTAGAAPATAPAPARRDWRDLFCGFAAELDVLRAAFDAVAAGGGHRAVVFRGDRGTGKTRLVREFYACLTRERDPERDWPAAALFQGRNVVIGPDVDRDPAVREPGARVESQREKAVRRRRRRVRHAAEGYRAGRAGNCCVEAGRAPGAYERLENSGEHSDREL